MLKTIFLSIILEALPFVLLGVLVSSVLQMFVTEETVRRWMPKNPLLGILFACLLGILFPLCECGMIPVVKRLLHKGMPPMIAIVFIVVGPVLNPVVYLSTRTAFQVYPTLAYARMGLAFAVAVILGLLLHFFMKKSPLRVSHAAVNGQGADHAHQHHSQETSGSGWTGKLIGMGKHAAGEFFEMGLYLIIGAMLTALIQTSLPREVLSGIGGQPGLSHLFMMGYAYVLSLCSTSDAFVASSFTTSFGYSSLLAFLVFGPMIDLKVTLMLHSMFKTRFVLALVAIVGVIVFLGSLTVYLLGWMT